jgi:hypothetical protein
MAARKRRRGGNAAKKGGGGQASGTSAAQGSFGKRGSHGAEDPAGLQGKLLEQAPLYQQLRKLLSLAVVGCIVAVAISVLIRINLPDFGALALFFNILAYLLVGVALFIWLGRLRPLRKQAAAAASACSEDAAKASDAAGDAGGRDGGGVEGGVEGSGRSGAEAGVEGSGRSGAEAGVEDLREDKPGLLGQLVNSIAGREPNANTAKPREYLRYRRIWRLLLLGGAVLVLLAWLSIGMFEGTPVALLVLLSAYIPIVAAIIIYRRKLRRPSS